MATIKRFTEIVAWQKGCRLVAEKYAWSVEAKQMKVVYEALVRR